MQVSRRRFIKVASVGGGALLLPSLLPGCARGVSEALRPWQGPPADEEQEPHGGHPQGDGRVVPLDQFMGEVVPAVEEVVHQLSLSPVTARLQEIQVCG